MPSPSHRIRVRPRTVLSELPWVLLALLIAILATIFFPSPRNRRPIVAVDPPRPMTAPISPRPTLENFSVVPISSATPLAETPPSPAEPIAIAEESPADSRPPLENVPSEKRDEVQRIASDYTELAEKVYAQSDGLIAPEDREKLAVLEKEKITDLANVLTPPELEEYQVRAKDTDRLKRR